MSAALGGTTGRTLAVAFAARAAAGLLLNAGPAGPRGFDFYGTIADNVLSGRGLGWDFYTGLGWKAANRPPLYPLLLAGIRGVAGSPATVATILVQAAVGALACLLPAMLARRWAGDRAGRVALWLAALWPYSILVDTGLVEHVVFAPLVLLSAVAALRALDTGAAGTSFGTGVAGGLAALARITFVPAIGLLALAVAVRRGVRPAAALALGAAAVLLPWALRNENVVGSFVLGTDGGRALWVGNAPGTFRHYPGRSIDDSERDMLLGMDRAQYEALTSLGEVAQDARFREMAFANLRADPAAAAWGGLRKVGALWSPVYNPAPVPAERQRPDRPLAPVAARLGERTNTARYLVHGVSFVLLLAGALAGTATVPRARADLVVLLLLLMAFTAAAAVFWGQPRYLAPLHGVGLALGAAAWGTRAARREGP